MMVAKGLGWPPSFHSKEEEFSTWTRKVENYFIGKAPILEELLLCAEKEDVNVIEPEHFIQAVGGAMTTEQVYTTNAGILGFLNGSISGPAQEIFDRATRRNGRTHGDAPLGTSTMAVTSASAISGMR